MLRLGTVLRRAVDGRGDLGARVLGLVALLLWHHLGLGSGRVDLVVPILVGIAAGVHRLHRGLLDHGLCGGRAWLVRGLALRGSGGGILLAERQDQKEAEAAEHDYGKAADNAAGDRTAGNRWLRQLAVGRR